jgi:hypothetical protein
MKSKVEISQEMDGQTDRGPLEELGNQRTKGYVRLGLVKLL